MNILPAAAENHLGVTWVVLNDYALGSIRELQEYRMDGRFLATEFTINPDFGAVATACGCYGESVTDAAEIDGAFQRALAANAEGVPAVLDFRVFPMRLKSSRDHFNLYRPDEARG